MEVQHGLASLCKIKVSDRIIKLEKRYCRTIFNAVESKNIPNEQLNNKFYDEKISYL